MVKRLATANAAITLAFLIMGVIVVIEAYSWPFRAALFPLLAGWLLLVFSALKLAIDVVTAVRARPVPVAASAHQPQDEDEEEDVFATASAGQWLVAFGWMAFFFVGLWLFGALVGIPLFALSYLRVASRESLVIAGGYAFACWAFVYGLFDRGLHVPLPAGVLLPFLGM